MIDLHQRQGNARAFYHLRHAKGAGMAPARVSTPHFANSMKIKCPICKHHYPGTLCGCYYRISYENLQS